MIKEWISAQYPDYNEKLLISRDVMYLTNKKNRKEQYILPLAHIAEMYVDFAYNVMSQQERLDAVLAPMEPVFCIRTVRGDLQLFGANNTEITYDYLGLEK